MAIGRRGSGRERLLDAPETAAPWLRLADGAPSGRAEARGPGRPAALGPVALDANPASDMVMNAQGTRLYVAGLDGNLRVYDLATRALLATWDVGTKLGGIDISRDGSFLMVTEQVLPSGSTGTSLSYRVDAATGQSSGFMAYTRFIGPQDVAILADGTALVTPAYYPAAFQDPVLWQINPATGQYTGQAGPPLTGLGTLLPTRDAGYVVHFPRGTSEGPLYLYQVGRGNAAGHDRYEDGVTGDNQGVQAVSAEAGLVAQYFYYDQIHIYRLEGLTHEMVLTSIGQFWPDVAGLAFDAAGRYLFILRSSTDTIYQLSVADWSTVRTIAVGGDVAPVGGNDIELGNNLVISPDGRFITVATTAGVQLIEQTAFPDTVVGTSGNDSYTAGAADFTLFGMMGNDILAGSVGNDLLDGGIGDDHLDGGGGNDRLLGALGADEILGGDGDDFLNGGIGADSMAGGIGNDVYVVDDAGDTVVETVSGGTDVIQTVLASFSLGAAANVENLTGIANENQSLTGNAGDNVIRSGGGNDMLAGGAGNDTYYVNDALDSVVDGAGQGEDAVYARVDYTLGFGQHVELLAVDPAAGSAPVTLRGNELGNVIVGNDGGNPLYGGAGQDWISGGAGNDRLVGGNGADHLDGGPGSDFFVYLSLADSAAALRSDGAKFMPDVITGFTSGEDWIDLSAIDAVAGTQANDAFIFIGAGAFTHHAGEVRYEASGGQAHIYADVNGDGLADMHIIAAATMLAAADFIL